jgi:hypothetical protein
MKINLEDVLPVRNTQGPKSNFFRLLANSSLFNLFPAYFSINYVKVIDGVLAQRTVLKDSITNFQWNIKEAKRSSRRQ